MRKGAVKKYTVLHVKQHGGVILSCTATDFTAHFKPDDIVTVRINGGEYDMPVCRNYSEVDTAEFVIVIDENDDDVTMSVNNGSFVERIGLARRGDDGWVLSENVKTPVTLSVSLKVRGGYSSEKLIRTNKREDYPHLTDEQYANFRAVNYGNLRKNVLFRSSSPIDPAIGRNREADAAAEKYGVKTVINLADKQSAAINYPGYNETYCSGCDTLFVSLEYDHEKESYGRSLAESFRFIASHKAPYLIHCKEGKDRTGVAAALCEALAGAFVGDIKEDYLLTFKYFFGTEGMSERYESIWQGNLRKILCSLFGVRELYDGELSSLARGYLIKNGMTEDEIDRLVSVLTGDDVR